MTPVLTAAGASASRDGYADVNAGGPTPVKHMVNIGLVTDDIFGQDKDRIGVGYTWSDPADRSLDKQNMIDAYYRVQLTPEIEIGPPLEVIFDPVRNPDDDTVYVWGSVHALHCSVCYRDVVWPGAEL